MLAAMARARESAARRHPGVLLVIRAPAPTPRNPQDPTGLLVIPNPRAVCVPLKPSATVVRSLALL